MRKGSKHLTQILDKVSYMTCFTDIFPCKILGNKYASIGKSLSRGLYTHLKGTNLDLTDWEVLAGEAQLRPIPHMR